MCNAYELGKRGGSFPSRLKAEAARELLTIDSFRLIRRTDPAPVILGDGSLAEMRWGFERTGLGTINNSRCENLGSPVWKESFAERRCLIPLAAYYEWSGPKGAKRTHRFTAADGGWLLAAGIWEESRGHGHRFSMITTRANRLVAPIHHRMPALLGPEEIGAYLDGGIDTFSPPADTLSVADAPNPLVRPKPPSSQGELF